MRLVDLGVVVPFVCLVMLTVLSATALANESQGTEAPVPTTIQVPPALLKWANPEAVAEVLAGIREEANVLWWGFDPADSTQYIRAAIASGAPKVRIPNVGANWVVLPLDLRDNLELILEEGVVLEAKKGAYHGSGHSVLNLYDVENVTIRGYGATLRMHKDDYANPALYDKSEWRHGINVRGSTNIQILGLTIKDTGGDGIYLGRGRVKPYNENVVIRDVVADNNYRQGLSVISVKGLLIESSVFKNTSGTSPQDGIDFEPNLPDEVLQDVVIRSTVLENNAGHGISFYLWNMENQYVSILIEDVVLRGNRFGFGLRGGINLSGEIKVRNCIIEDTKGNAIRMRGHRAAETLQFTLEDCFVGNAAQDHESSYEQSVPIYMGSGTRVGKVSFNNVVVVDNMDRPAVQGSSVSDAFFDIHGEIMLMNPFFDGAFRPVFLDGPRENVTLRVERTESVVRPNIRVDAVEGDGCCVEQLRPEPGIRFANLSAVRPFTTVQGAFVPAIEIVAADGLPLEAVEVQLDGNVIYQGDSLPGTGELTIDTAQLSDGLHELAVTVVYDQGKRIQGKAVFESLNAEPQVLFADDFSSYETGSRPDNWRIQGSNVSIQVTEDPLADGGRVLHVRADAGERRDVGFEGPVWDAAARDARVIALEFDVYHLSSTANLYVVAPGSIAVHLRIIEPGELRRGDSLLGVLGKGWNRIRIVADRLQGTGQAYVVDLDNPGQTALPATFTFRESLGSWEEARIRFMHAVFPDRPVEIYYDNFKVWIVEE